MRSPGGGELSLSACPGVGNRPLNENKIANPRGYARGGGMVTGRIEPCIIGGEFERRFCPEGRGFEQANQTKKHSKMGQKKIKKQSKHVLNKLP